MPLPTPLVRLLWITSCSGAVRFSVAICAYSHSARSRSRQTCEDGKTHCPTRCDCGGGMLEAGGDVVDGHENRCEQDRDTKCEGHDKEWLNEGDERIDGVIPLSTIETSHGLEYFAHISRLFAYFHHGHDDAGHLGMLSERLRYGQASLHIHGRIGEHSLVRRVLDDERGYLQTAEYLDAAPEHR